jgi:hypothetical protein
LPPDGQSKPQNRQIDLLAHPTRRGAPECFLHRGHWCCRALSAILSAIIVPPWGREGRMKDKG